MKSCFLSYDYTSKIFDIFSGKTNKGKVIRTFSITTKKPSLMAFAPTIVSNEMIYKCVFQIINYYQRQGYTVYFDLYISRIFDEFEPVWKNSRDIEQERSLVDTTVIQID